MADQATQQKIERKYYAHFIDASFGGVTTNYVRLGKDLEEYNEELNPDVEVKKNIIGEQSVQHNGYEVQSEVDTYYAYTGEPLYEHLADIANERKTGDDCLTTKVDVLLKPDGTVVWAYKEDVKVIPSSIGGDTSGVQIPFTIYNAGKACWKSSNSVSHSAQGIVIGKAGLVLPFLAYIITGLILSAGAAPIHELIEKVRASRDTILLPGEIFESEKGARNE